MKHVIIDIVIIVAFGLAGLFVGGCDQAKPQGAIYSPCSVAVAEYQGRVFYLYCTPTNALAATRRTPLVKRLGASLYVQNHNLHAPKRAFDK